MYIFNKIQVIGYINPQVYILFILMLPYEIAGFWLLTLAFMMGLSVDFFMHTPGMHAAASVFLAFLRPGVIRLVGRKDDLEPMQYPNIRDSGTGWFLAYTIILVFMHHLFLFYLEVFRFREFFATLVKVILSSAFTFLLVMISEYLFYSRQK